MRNLFVFLFASALGAGLMFACTTPAEKDALDSEGDRRSASVESCKVPGNKGDPKLHAADPDFSYCAQFVDSECRLGAFGITVRDLLVPSGLDPYLAIPPHDLGAYCPNYAKFDDATRRRFWVWILMALAYEESGCGEPSVVQAVRNYYRKYQGTKQASLAAADGPFALPHSDKDRAYRSDLCRDARIAADADALPDHVFPGEPGSPVYLGPSLIADPAASARCTMAMLAKQFAERGTLVHSRSYWHWLTRTGPLTKRLGDFGPCADAPAGN